MGEPHFYRPSAELAAALREYQAAYDAHIETVVRPFVAEHPDHEPIINTATQAVIGFKDGKPSEPPPAGLTRSSRRTYLAPVRGSAGQQWQDWQRKLQFPIRKERVFDQFKVGHVTGATDSGRTAMHYPNFIDFGDDEGGMFVYYGTGLTTVPDALTPAKRSEFYALQEAYNERREEHPPSVWEQRLGVTVRDPDGWRGTRTMPSKNWDIPITRGEFVARLQGCTVDVRTALEVRQTYWDEAQRWLASLEQGATA